MLLMWCLAMSSVCCGSCRFFSRICQLFDEVVEFNDRCPFWSDMNG